MIEVTDAASEMLTRYLEQNNFDIDAPMRVMKHAGCGGTSLALAFDDPGPRDRTFNSGKMVFIVDADLLEECGALTVDFVESVGNDGGCGCSGGGGAKLTISSQKALAQLSAPSGGGCGCGSGGCG